MLGSSQSGITEAGSSLRYSSTTNMSSWPLKIQLRASPAFFPRVRTKASMPQPA